MCGKKHMSDNLIGKFKTAVSLTVFESTVYTHCAPKCYASDFDGNGKFLQAFAKMSGSNYRSFFTITLTTKSEATGNTYRTTLTPIEFVKMVAWELQSGVMEGFGKAMFQHDKGFERNEAQESIDSNTKELYRSYEDATHYWRVMMADEQDKVMNREEIASTVAEPFDTDVSENK